jgi:hypothetical protein
VTRAVVKRLLPLLLFFALACHTVSTLFPPTASAPAAPLAPTSPPSASLPATSTAEAPPPSTLTPGVPTPSFVTPVPTTPYPSLPPTLPPVVSLIGDVVTFHPGPQYYTGDILSLAVAAEPTWHEARVSIHLGEAAGPIIAAGSFGSFGIGGRPQATFWWAWDTAGLQGAQTLTVVVRPAAGGEALATSSQTVTLLPADQRPMPEPLARWALAESACCIFHFLTGTAAARDIDQIRAEADQAFERVEQALRVQRLGKVNFTLLSRLLGHGGFASGEIYLTYVDRNPAGLDLATVFAHEGTHILDRQIADRRPTMLTEGLAVFVAGGHYHPEDLDRRAAALLALDRYIPLAELARDFYTAQHEIGYLQAGALVKYLVDTYGWEKFRGLYAAFQPADDQARMLAAGLQAHYGLSLAALEAEWLAHLRAQPAAPADVEHLRLTIALFDALRRYQQVNDPAAYFLTAWLPDGPEARQRGVVADFVRSPRAPENIALEAMLATAERALTREDYPAAEALIRAVNAVLETRNLFFDPLATRYLHIVMDLAAQGYEAQTIDLTGPTPALTAIRAWPTLETVTYNSRQ